MSNNLPVLKPKKLSCAIVLLLTSIILGFSNYILVNEISSQFYIYSFDRRFFSTVLSNTIQLFLVYQISSGKKWARNTFLVLLVLGAFLVKVSVIASFKFNIFVGLISATSSIIQIIAITMIYSSEVHNWFKLKNQVDKSN